jgi:hypothetical protein
MRKHRCSLNCKPSRYRNVNELRDGDTKPLRNCSSRRPPGQRRDALNQSLLRSDSIGTEKAPASQTGRHKAQPKSRGFDAAISVSPHSVLYPRERFAPHAERRFGPPVCFFCDRSQGDDARRMFLDCNADRNRCDITSDKRAVTGGVVYDKTRRMLSWGRHSCASMRTALPRTHGAACAARWTHGGAML